MTTRDWIALGVSYVYAGGLLFLAEAVRRWRGYPQDFTRKIVHIGAGMWVFGVLALFDTWYIGIIPFATFIFINYILWRYKVLGAMDAEDSTPGTVYFALAITILFVAFWRTDSPSDRGYIAAAGTMAMTWGDSMASLLGRRFGRHKYTVLGSTRSFEGSAAMLVASTLAMFLTLLLVPGSALSPLSAPLGAGMALTAAFAGALVATVAEAVSPAGTDNLSVPLLAGAMIFLVLVLSGM
ncbi:diacylglycerol/polyprenol kinase family protein [Candidatus Chloroploca asiatica]|uniref:Phosphatidate cytidylyltransferase n=1 Tax=Candidatus Chloroploca asiatica TaxID=1506545 RepID=A0A2H3L3X0_9CHLR|nr:phosphatidate cytidylyltransferase [Candidatus Chloroploca asiatica]PDV96930.1 phosphatidate cytidylyltransferase [Candidatus Chloroploca asiatica]